MVDHLACMWGLRQLGSTFRARCSLGLRFSMIFNALVNVGLKFLLGSSLKPGLNANSTDGLFLICFYHSNPTLADVSPDGCVFRVFSSKDLLSSWARCKVHQDAWGKYRVSVLRWTISPSRTHLYVLFQGLASSWDYSGGKYETGCCCMLSINETS